MTISPCNPVDVDRVDRLDVVQERGVGSHVGVGTSIDEEMVGRPELSGGTEGGVCDV